MNGLTRALSACPLACALLLAQALAPATNNAQAPPAKPPASKAPMGPPSPNRATIPSFLSRKAPTPAGVFVSA